MRFKWANRNLDLFCAHPVLTVDMHFNFRFGDGSLSFFFRLGRLRPAFACFE